MNSKQKYVFVKTLIYAERELRSGMHAERNMILDMLILIRADKQDELLLSYNDRKLESY